MFMINKRQLAVFIFISLILLFQSGCAVLGLPGQALSIVGSLVGEVLKLAQKLPSPPPGVFF